MENDHPVTHKEFEAGLAKLEAVLADAKAEMAAQMAAQEERLTERLTEFSRQIETNLLTAFHGYGKGQSSRLHSVETNAQDLGVRVATLEDRVLALETRPRL
jgi:hypothetical protein